MTAALTGALVIGATLGLLGSGGSILTVPVLIYGLGLPEKTAIASSLAIVASVALAGAALHTRRSGISRRCLWAFGLPGIAGAAAGGALAGYVPAPMQMTLFAGVLLGAGVMMLRRTGDDPASPLCGPLPPMLAAGAGVGAITGLIGVGGGFLLVPALQRFGHIGLSVAIGTSLGLIGLNSVLGLTGQWMSGAVTAIPLAEVALFIGVGMAGLLAGQYGGSRLPIRLRKHAFVGLLFAVGGYTSLQVLVSHAAL